MAASDVTTYEKHDEELRKELLRKHRNGVHNKKRTYKRGGA